MPRSGRGARFVADLARLHVESAAYDRIADAVGPYARTAVEARDAAHRVTSAYHATDDLRAYGRRAAAQAPVHAPGQRPLSVAGELFHGPDERKRALAALATDFAALQNDLAISATTAGDLDWVRLVVLPILTDWHTFVTRINDNDLSIFTLDWSSLEEWHGRLSRLRELARTRGIALVSPEPAALPRTIWERGGSGTGSAADVALSFLRVSVYGIIAVTGFVGFFSILKGWRARSQNARDEAEIAEIERIMHSVH